MRKRRPTRRFFLVILIVLLAAAGILYFTGHLPLAWYCASHFGIETAASAVDYNGNGVDDYRDIMLGARQDAKNRPAYDSRYWDEGYPPDDIGVCTDVVWRAFRNAGYCLRDMVDADVAARPEAYDHREGLQYRFSPRIQPAGLL